MFGLHLKNRIIMMYQEWHRANESREPKGTPTGSGKGTLNCSVRSFRPEAEDEEDTQDKDLFLWRRRKNI